MSNVSNGTRVVESTRNWLADVDIDKAVKALISLASTVQAADNVVQEFKKDLAGVETLDILCRKYLYVAGLFGIKNLEERAACNPPMATDIDIAATNYYSLLSILILRKWG